MYILNHPKNVLISKNYIPARILYCAAIILALPLSAASEEAIKVQSTPHVQAANLTPIQTSGNSNIPETTSKEPANSIIKVQAEQKSDKSSNNAETTADAKTVVQTQSTQQAQNQSDNKTEPIQKGKATYEPPVQLVKPQGQAVTSLTTPADIEFEACVKMYPINAEKLFILTLGAIEANNFTIGEIQTRGGYITFKAANKEFLATIAEVDKKNAMLKINPANGVYHFAPGIVSKMFEYITCKISGSN